MEVKLKGWGKFRIWLFWLFYGIKVERVIYAETLWYIPHFGAEEAKIIVDTSRMKSDGLVAMEEWMRGEQMELDGLELEDGEVYVMEDVLLTNQTAWKRHLFKKPELIDSVWIF